MLSYMVYGLFILGGINKKFKEDISMSAVNSNQVRLTKKLVVIGPYGSFKSFEGEYVSSGQRIRLSIEGAWAMAKNGLLENVIATGDPIIPVLTAEQEAMEQTYEYAPEELAKMGFQGINGFDFDTLPIETELI